MIVTDHFVYIHTSRTAGTFLNQLIMKQVPGARMLRYHGHLRDLPAEFAHLPVIGFVRNPWDWYVSMFFDYRRKQQYVFQVLSERGRLDFAATVTRFLTLGDGSDESRALLAELAAAAPREIDARQPGRNGLPGLCAADFEGYAEDQGYYSWLFRLMYAADVEHDVHIGRFENLRDDALRLLEATGTPVTDRMRRYLGEARAVNASPRPPSWGGGYSPELERLVADKDRYLVERFGYRFAPGD